MFKQYSQADYFNMLPLSDAQKLEIIHDFIDTGKYDKIAESKMNSEDMIIKKEKDDSKDDQSSVSDSSDSSQTIS